MSVATISLLCLSLVLATEARVHIGNLNHLAHGVYGNFSVEDANTFYIDHFFYDGGGPAAYHYYYSPGTVPRRTGGGFFGPQLKFDGVGYTDATITVTLPSGVTVCEIGWYTIWCQAANQLFATIELTDQFRATYCSPFTPVGPEVPTTEISTMTDPPTNMTPVEPTMSTTEGSTDTPTNATPPPPLTVEPPTSGTENCVPLDASTRLFWTLNRNTSVATFKLCGCVSTDPADNEYIAFGLSGSDDRTNMDGADVAVTWVDGKTGTANAVDYFLSTQQGRAQCRGGVGVCPDSQDSSGECTDDIFDVSGERRNGEQCVTYSRKFSTADTKCDKAFDASAPQYVAWGVGGIEQTAFKHFRRAEASSDPIDLGRDPRFQCRGILKCLTCPAFPSSTINAPKNTTFNIKIGPSGLNRGYTAITGSVGWGIAYWINGLLIPELVVRRNKTYVFIVEAGDDSSKSAEYHPFYLTSSPIGGRVFNTQDQNVGEVIYAGFNETNHPFIAGRYCEYMENKEAERLRVQCGTSQQYATAVLETSKCNQGDAYVFEWTPDETTPDTLYYQCAVHRNLGWKITVSDFDLNTGGQSGAVAVIPHILSVLLLITLAAVFN